jgi:hypothetical protein
MPVTTPLLATAKDKDHKGGVLKERSCHPSIPSLEPMMVSESEMTLALAMWSGRTVATVDLGFGGVRRKEGGGQRMRPRPPCGALERGGDPF